MESERRGEGTPEDGPWPYGGCLPGDCAAVDEARIALGLPPSPPGMPPLGPWALRLFGGGDPAHAAALAHAALCPPDTRAEGILLLFRRSPGRLTPHLDLLEALWEGQPLVAAAAPVDGVGHPPGEGASAWGGPGLWAGRVLGRVGAAMLGADPSAWAPAAEALGRVLAFFMPLGRVLGPEGEGLPPETAPNLALALGSPLPEGLALALAGRPVTQGRRREVGAALGEAGVQGRLRARCGLALADLRDALPPAAEGAWLLEALQGSLETLLGVARTLALMEALGGAPAPPVGEAALGRGISLAVQGLEASGALFTSVERQRFGMPLWPDADLQAPFFAHATVELALSAAGRERGYAIRALIEGMPAEALRYFTGWRGIPPDADSLGVALRLGAIPGVSEEGSVCASRLQGWLGHLSPNLDDGGLFPVWLRQGPEGSNVDPPLIPWAGDDCTASRLSLVLGLLAHDPARFRRPIQEMLGWVLARLQGGRLGGSYYYPRAFGEALLLRSLEGSARAGIPLPQGAGDPLTLARALAEGWLGEQRTSGALGTPLETAWRLAAIAPLGIGTPAALWRGARLILESQESGGLWARAPVWRTLGALGEPAWHGGEALSAAYALEALVALRARLMGEVG